jgi:murein DD-endopeptidase MepM/ murein hydrolase activator NlpD
MIGKLSAWSRTHRKGASTVEFIIILPLFILLCLVTWQLVVAGRAVMDTQAALRDAVRVASVTGDAEKGKAQFKVTFMEGKPYQVDSFEIRIDGDEVKAWAKTRIPLIFMADKSTFTYRSTAEAPVLNPWKSWAGGPSGPWLTSGGILGPPVRMWILTSRFGPRPDPKYGGKAFHKGIDLSGPPGTPIYAAADGVVVHAGPGTGYGNYIKIDHMNGLQTIYAHMYAEQIYVRNGQRVTRGQHIAGIGNAGKSTGPHLHFEVIVGGVKVDPLLYVSRSSVATR